MSDPAAEKDAQGAQDLQALSIAAFVKLLAELISRLADKEVKMDDLVLMSGTKKVFPSDDPQYDLIAKLKDAVIDPSKKASFRVFLEYPDGKREEVCRQTAGKVLHDPLGLIPSLRAMMAQEAIDKFTQDNTPKLVVETDPLVEGQKTTLQEVKTKLQSEPKTQLQTAPVQAQPKAGNGQKSGVKTELEMLPDFAPTSVEDDQPIVDDAWADLSEDDTAQTIEAKAVPDVSEAEQVPMVEATEFSTRTQNEMRMLGKLDQLEEALADAQERANTPGFEYLKNQTWYKDLEAETMALQKQLGMTASISKSGDKAEEELDATSVEESVKEYHSDPQDWEDSQQNWQESPIDGFASLEDFEDAVERQMEYEIAMLEHTNGTGEVVDAAQVIDAEIAKSEDLYDADSFFDAEVDAISLEVPSPDLVALSYSVYEAEMAMQARELELTENLVDPLDDTEYLKLKATAQTLENEWNSTYEALEGNNPPQEAPLISAFVPVTEKSNTERLNDYIQVALRERQASGLASQVERSEASLNSATPSQDWRIRTRDDDLKALETELIAWGENPANNAEYQALSAEIAQEQTSGLLVIADRIEQNTVTLADLDRSIKATGLNPLRDERYMALLNDTTALIGEWDAGYSKIQPQLTPSLTATAQPESNGDRLDAHIQESLIPRTALIPVELIPPIVALDEVRNLASYYGPTIEAVAVNQPDPVVAAPIVVAPVEDLGVAQFQAEVTTLSSQIEHMREAANQRLGEIVLFAHDIRTEVIEPYVKDWATNTAAIVEQRAQTWGDRLRDAATQLKDVVVERAANDWQITKDTVADAATQFKDYAQERATQDTQVVKEFVTAKAQHAWVDIQRNAIGSEKVDKGIDTLLKYLPNAQITDLGGIAENDGYTFARMNDSTAIFNGDGKPIYKDGLTTEHTTGQDRVYLAKFPDVAQNAAQTIEAARATAISSAAEPAQSAGSGMSARR